MQQFKLLILFLFFQQFIIAQQFNYTTITTTQGLPSTETYAVLKDKRGYVWFATDHGLARYNGKEFTTYNFSDGLTDNTVLRMCEDNKGRIWFVTHSNELFYWEGGKIHKTSLSKLLSITLPAWDPIFTLYIDSSQNIWFNSLSGLYISDKQHQYTTLTKRKPFNGRNTSIEVIDNKIALDLKIRKSKLKSVTDPFYTYNFAYRENNTIQYFDTLIQKKDLKITINRNDAAYSKNGTIFYSHDFTLFCISKNKKIETIKFDKEIIEITIDEKNNLWVGLWKGGLQYFKNADIHSRPVRMLNDCTVSDVWADASGAWCTTLEKGVFYIPSLSIYAYSNIPNLNDRIFSISTFRDKMLISTLGNLIFETQPDTILPFTLFKKFQPPGIKFYGLREFNDKIYLIWGEHTDILDQSLNKIGPNEPVTGYLAGQDLLKGPDNSLWLLNVTGVKELTCNKEPTPVYTVPYRLTSAVVDKGRRLLIGSKRGIYLIENGRISWLNKINPLLKCPISQLLKDAEGTVWIATAGNGLLKFKNNKVAQISIREGLISNICTSLEMDKSGNLWIGTNKGLSCLRNSTDTNKKWEIKNLTVSNGLTSNEICHLKAFKNTLWVGTKLGLNSIDLDNVFTNDESPTYIQSVRINNKTVEPDQSTFRHDQNTVKIELDGLAYSGNSEQRFRFRLIGLDSTWQEIKTNEVLFNSLPPGNYSFQASVINADGTWSKKKALYHFIINKPFWFTWWFILLELIVVALIVYLIILWRTNIIRKKEHEKLKINKLLAEYQMKALTAQMNPHFIFNAINSIQNFIIQNHSTLAYDYLIKFSNLIRMVLNNSKDNEISLQQELETLAIYVELEQLRFENSFDYRVNIDPGLDINSLVIPALLLQPYIENGIWHGLMPLENRKGTITLTIIEQDEFLKITITDNGIGRKASGLIEKKMVSKHHRSVGMELTGKRIEVFGQESTFSLQIIDNYNENNEPTGTTVEIILPMVEMY
jgi:ligand-binding sensor domain-containing protein